MLMVEGRTEGKMQTQISLFRGRNGNGEAVYLCTSAKYWLKKCLLLPGVFSEKGQA